MRSHKTAAVLRDSYHGLSWKEFASLVWGALFKNQRVAIYCCSVSDPSSGDGSPPPEIAKGHLADLVAERKRRRDVPWELKCDQYDGVTDFFVHRCSQGIGHISWVYFEHHPNRILRLRDGECEVKFCLTFPEFRGRGLYPSALKAIQQHVGALGYERCFVCVAHDNLRSIRGIEKAGFHYVGRTTIRKALGFQVSRRVKTHSLKLPPVL